MALHRVLQHLVWLSPAKATADTVALNWWTIQYRPTFCRGPILAVAIGRRCRGLPGFSEDTPLADCSAPSHSPLLASKSNTMTDAMFLPSPPPHLFVGREKELVWLQSQIESHERPFNQPIVVRGEAGIGKTALVSGFFSFRDAESQPLWVSCREWSQLSPDFYAVIRTSELKCCSIDLRYRSLDGLNKSVSSPIDPRI